MKDFQDKQDQIWDHYQTSGTDKFTFEVYGRLRFILKHITSRNRVLNIGVGAGQFEELALENHEIYSLDPSETSIQNLKTRLGLHADRAKVGYSNEIPFEDSTFDSVVMSEVLEHLTNDVIEGTLQEVERVLVPGGVFVGTVPANENLQENMVFCPDCNKTFHIWGHCQSFNEARLRDFLETTFQVEKVVDKPLVNFSERDLKGKVKGFMRVLLYQMNLFKTYGSLFFIARKVG